MTPSDTAGLKCPPLQPRGEGSLEARSKAHHEVRLCTLACPSSWACRLDRLSPAVSRNVANPPFSHCGGMEAQRELGMGGQTLGGQTLGGLGNKHIGRTFMNSPRPHRACSSPPETGPGSTSAHYIGNCKTKTLVRVQCESLPASHTAVAIFLSGTQARWLTFSPSQVTTRPT